MLEMQLLGPDQCSKIFTQAKQPVWIYKFSDAKLGATLSLATHGEPQSGKLSLGGFRIAPKARVLSPGYNNDREAIELAVGMEAKIYWSRLVKAGGPIGIQNLQNIVGGKCVLLPADGARVGEEHDTKLLDFAIAAFKQFEKESGLLFNTGQDLGHGVLSDGKTYSLDYVNARYTGCINTDTSHPTAEGNYRLLLGMLKGVGLDPTKARIGLIGCGKIGARVLMQLSELGASIFAMESLASKREELTKEFGCHVWAAEKRDAFLSQEMDALVVNANGGSLSPEAVALIVQNKRLKLICGSENLPFPDAKAEDTLHKAGKIYCPTELGGMFGYLTAAEVFYSMAQNVSFKMDDMLHAAQRLEQVGYQVVSSIVANNYKYSFKQEVQALYRNS